MLSKKQKLDLQELEAMFADELNEEQEEEIYVAS